MPNIITNKVTFYGDSIDKLNELFDKIRCVHFINNNPYTIDFDNIIHTPVDFIHQYHIYTEKMNWRLMHWGTKWNALNHNADSTEITDKSISIVFDTVWNPPIPIFEKILRMYPDLVTGIDVITTSEDYGEYVCKYYMKKDSIF